MQPEPPPLSSPVPLEALHDLSAFDCGAPALNEYLKKYALVNHQNQSARTYVATRGASVVGYYTLAAGSVRREDESPFPAGDHSSLILPEASVGGTATG